MGERMGMTSEVRSSEKPSIMQRLPGSIELGVVGVVQRFEVVVVALGHHFVLQEFLGALQLQIGARGFNLGLLKVRPGLRRIAALQYSELLSLASLPGPATPSAPRRVR